MSVAVGVLFCDQVNSTQLLMMLGDEVAEELRRDLVAALNRAVITSRGDVVKGTGDGLMVVFEGDPSDAVRCGALLQRSVGRLAARDATSAMALRVGISFGDVISDDGDWFGAAVNLAARLCAAAGPGEIVVDEHLVLRAGRNYVWTDEQRLQLKGFQESVPTRKLAWQREDIGDRWVVQPALDLDGCSPMVGCDVEQAMLSASWAQTLQDRRISFIAGEAGVGVTRVAAELASRAARDGTVLFGACGAGTPALAQMIRWWAGSHSVADLADAVGTADALAAWVPLVGLRLGLPGGENPPRASLIACSEVFLSRVSSTRPLLLVFDDVHLADADEIDMIGAVLTSSLLTSCMVVLGYRTSDGVAEGGVAALLEKVSCVAGVTINQLDPLPASAIETWIDSALVVADESTRDDIVALVATETGGYPSAVVAVFDALAARRMTRDADGIGLADVIAAIASSCPYKGLTPYQAGDQARFFGRDALVRELIGQVESTGFVAVVGPSGSGKSSVVRAGVLPAIRDGSAANARDTITVSPGSRPVDALIATVARRRDSLGNPTVSARTTDVVVEWWIDELTSERDAPGRRILLFIDQFEECFTQCEDDGQRDTFFEMVTAAAGADRVAVIIAVRGDHYGHLAARPSLARAVEANTVLVGAMLDGELRLAITEPAAAAGLAVEPGLVDVIVGDVSGRPGALPLLSHALLETWRRRRHRTLTLDAYRQVGGVNAAIARSADRVFEQLDAGEQHLFRRLCLRLTSVGETGEDSRRRVPHSELAAIDGGTTSVTAIVDVLTQARLLTADDTSVEFAHEALLREWPRLREWIDEDREELRAIARIQRAAVDWQNSGREEALLLRGSRLAAASDYAADAKMDLNNIEVEFVRESRLHADTERDALAAEARRQRQANRRLRRLLAGVAALLVVALVAGVIAVQQRGRATANGRESALRAVVADSLSLRRNQRDLAALLAVEAYRRAPRPDTEAALFGTFTAAPGIGRTVHIEPGMHPKLVLSDGKTILLQNDDGGLHFVDFATGVEQSRLDAPAGNLDATYPSLSADGRYLAANFHDGSDADIGNSLIVWDLQTGQRRFGSVEVPFSVGATSINSDGSLVAVGGGMDARVQVYDGKTGALLRELDRIPRPDGAKFGRNTAAVGFAPNGQLIVGSQTGVIRFVDASTGRETRRIKGPPETSEARIQFSTDGLSLLTGGFKGLMRYDLESGTAKWPAPAPFSCAGVAYAAIIGAYLCGSQDARVVTIDIATGAQLRGQFDTQRGTADVEMMSDGVTLLEFGAGNTYTQWRLDGSGLISHLFVDPRTRSRLHR